MKRSFILFCACCLYICSYADDITVFRALVHRVIPTHASCFIVNKLPDKGYDYFKLSSQGDKIEIGGNNANSMAVALNYYLKYYCHTTFSWYVDDKFDATVSLPVVEKDITIDVRCKSRFFLNYCTFGYTMPWWSWRDWEHFIDWMAMNGINMPLAITGQEAIWYKIWRELGLSDQDIRSYFTGPAHLPWHRMLNIDYWQGNIPMSWLNDQEELQKKIVFRERELNMHPVLPAFAGHVPEKLKLIYPQAKITKLSAWGGFSDQYACSFLDPIDPLFAKIQKLFLQKQKEIYGTDHIYGIDLFNELQPPSYEPSYLSRVAKQVYGTLAKVDRDAKWLQMTWLFFNDQKHWTNERIKAFTTAYPKEKSILLDYFCEDYQVWKKTNKYFGVPYIWCYLGNFGGNTMLAGNLYDIDKRMEDTYKNGGKNLAGVGSTLEGFDCNPFMYEYVFEKAWKLKHDVKHWVSHLADERIGKKDENGRYAWKLLIDSIYISSAHTVQGSIMCLRPTFDNIKTFDSWNKIPYDNKTLLKVIGLLLQVNSTSNTYQYDIVNLTRQLMGNYFEDACKEYITAYQQTNFAMLKEKENVLLQLIYDTNRLVSTQSSFLVGKWIKEARDKGLDEEEKLYYERNARNILTTWGDKAAPLSDYANRSWGGLISTYYGERWKMFFAAVNRAMLNGNKLEGKNYDEYLKDVCEYEKCWWNDCIGQFPDQPKGNSVYIAKQLYLKYKDLIAKH